MKAVGKSETSGKRKKNISRISICGLRALTGEEKRSASKHLMTFSVKLCPRILFAKSAEASYGDWPRMLCLPMAHCPSSPQAFGLAARKIRPRVALLYRLPPACSAAAFSSAPLCNGTRQAVRIISPRGRRGKQDGGSALGVIGKKNSTDLVLFFKRVFKNNPHFADFD
jgi:hypothetical protein